VTRLRTILGRSLRLRCPRCGEGRLFSGLLRTAPSCGVCGLVTAPEPGYYLGAIYINYGATALLGLLLVLVLLPDLPTPWLVGVLAVHCVVFPTWFFRYSRSLWLGFDFYRHAREDAPSRRE
jgi:uncharacterized protein (DUF983 family)